MKVNVRKLQKSRNQLYINIPADIIEKYNLNVGEYIKLTDEHDYIKFELLR